jgi:hypothetical protein
LQAQIEVLRHADRHKVSSSRITDRSDIDLKREPISADFRNDFRAEFLGDVEQHDRLVFAAEDLDFTFKITIGTVLIKTAVYKNLVHTRRWMKFFQEQIVLGERDGQNDIIHRADPVQTASA